MADTKVQGINRANVTYPQPYQIASSMLRKYAFSGSFAPNAQSSSPARDFHTPG